MGSKVFHDLISESFDFQLKFSAIQSIAEKPWNIANISLETIKKVRLFDVHAHRVLETAIEMVCTSIKFCNPFTPK